jgi:hypothetical protein
LAGSFPLVGIYTELSRAESLNIGRPMKIRKQAFRLQEVTPAAKWTSPSKWHYRELSRVQVGDPYLDRLWKVAGVPPEMRS